MKQGDRWAFISKKYSVSDQFDKILSGTDNDVIHISKNQTNITDPHTDLKSIVYSQFTYLIGFF